MQAPEWFRIARDSAAGEAPAANARLVVGEIALSIVLLLGTGLLVRTIFRLANIPLGFRTDRLFLSGVALPRIKYQENAAEARFYLRVQQNLRHAPAIEGVGFTHGLPLGGNFGTNFIVQGMSYVPGAASGTRF